MPGWEAFSSPKRHPFGYAARFSPGIGIRRGGGLGSSAGAPRRRAQPFPPGAKAVVLRAPESRRLFRRGTRAVPVSSAAAGNSRHFLAVPGRRQRRGEYPLSILAHGPMIGTVASASAYFGPPVFAI